MFGMRLGDSSLAFVLWEMAGQNWSPGSLEGERWLADEVLFKQQVSPSLIKAHPCVSAAGSGYLPASAAAGC